MVVHDDLEILVPLTECGIDHKVITKSQALALLSETLRSCCIAYFCDVVISTKQIAN